MKLKFGRLIAAVLIVTLCGQFMMPQKQVNAGIMNEGIIKGIFGIDNEVVGVVFDSYWGIKTGSVADQFIAIQNAKLQQFWELGVKGVPVNKIANQTIKNTKYWSGAGKFVKWSGAFIGAADTIFDSIDIAKHVWDPSKTEYQKGWSKTAKFFDNLLWMGGNYAGWITTGYTIAGVFSPAVVATGVGAVVTGPAFAVGVAVVGLTRVVFKSQTFSDLVDLAKGKKKLVFAPLQRPDIKEGLDIIKEEFGFDLYDHSDKEIPDPSTGIPVYKPNIYLYSQEDRQVNVQLLEENRITKSIPLYEPSFGWDTQVVNGSINGEEDFLFYEALVPDSGFQKETGWVVHGDHLEGDMKKILELYQFSEREQSDFLEFWAVKLTTDKDYIFYNQETEIIDTIMPISVTPNPRYSYRIWFYIEEESNQYLQEPRNIDVINNREDTLVEWGGITLIPLCKE